jgi:hypothetical protein
VQVGLADDGHAAFGLGRPGAGQATGVSFGGNGARCDHLRPAAGWRSGEVDQILDAESQARPGIGESGDERGHAEAWHSTVLLRPVQGVEYQLAYEHMFA